MVLGKSVWRAALLAAALSCGQAQASVSKEVRSWNVNCSNGLTCDISFSDWSSKAVQSIGFQRQGAPHAAIDLRLHAGREFSPDQDPSVTYRFSVDGREMLVLAAKDLTKEERGGVYFYPDPARVLALLTAMEAGKTAAVAVSGKAGSQVLQVKLDGVKDAVLYLDEVQGRLGRVDALQAKGDKKPPRHAMAKDIKTLEDMPAIVRKDFTDSGGACSDLLPETIGLFHGFEVTIGRVSLIGVPCATGGAYNQPYALYNVSEVIERISFPDMRDGKPTIMSTAMNLDFDAVTMTMTSFFRGRGIGDCGEYFKWQVDKAGNRLELLEIRAKGECDAKDNDPTKFPLVWPKP